MQKILLAIITLALFLPSLFNSTLQTTNHYNGKEKFDPSLSALHTVARLEAFTDSIANTQKIIPGTYEYAALLDSIIEYRFYHGFSHFSLSQNWIAALAGKYVKEDYNCKVQPDEILQHDNAACSQQALVMMHILRNKKMNYRSLGFPHHYALEVKADGQWYFFDSNMEPFIAKEQRSLEHWNHQNDSLKKYYDTKKHAAINYQLGNNEMAIIGEVNEVPGKNLAIFHAITGGFSKFAWLMPFLLLLFKGGFNIEIPFVAVMGKRKKPAFSLQS